MKKTHLNSFARLAVILLLVGMLCSLAGCSKESKLVGLYKGAQDSVLELRKDGTCVYSEPDSTGTGTGTWYLEDDTIYIHVSNIGYTLYANVSDFDDCFLLKADSYYWNTEFFEKTD